MYSSIVRKACKCGCSKYPTIGYKGFNADCRPDLKAAQIKKQKDRNALRSDLAHVRKLAVEEDGNRELANKHYSRSRLLSKADMAFGNFIKGRDTDKNGDITCPCCDKKFPAKSSVTGRNNAIVQCLHFVTRKDYNLRWDETNAKAGCSPCNLDMALNPKGKAYQGYRNKLVLQLGEEEVQRMELSPRNINILDTQQMKNVIEHYTTYIN